MPHVEPLVARSVRLAIPEFENDAPDLAKDARSYVRQELEHHKQHATFNERIITVHPGMAKIDRLLGWSFERLGRRSLAFRLAFAAGFETVAYSGARWTDDRLHKLFDDADPVASTLFLWHLAEEIEHKTVAFDVFAIYAEKVRFAKLRQLSGLVTAAVMLSMFALIGTWALMIAQRSFFSPRAHANLIRWSLSFIFEVMPLMAVSLLPSHHPRTLTDPAWMAQWLANFNEATGQIPIWNDLTWSAIEAPRQADSGPVPESGWLEGNRVLNEFDPLTQEPSGVSRVDDLLDLEELRRSVR